MAENEPQHVDAAAHRQTAADTERRQQPSRLNVPNALCGIRLAGSFVLLVLAWLDLPVAFVCLLVFLLLTDWLDGKLAVMLNQRTTFGARFDSIADASMYGALLIGAWWFRSDLLARETPWIAVGVLSYALTSVAGLIKFGRLPSYHTRLAKSSWFFVASGSVALFALGWSWPLRLAAAIVTLTNLEATAITFILPSWEANVPSLYFVLRRNRRNQSTKTQ